MIDYIPKLGSVWIGIANGPCRCGTCKKRIGKKFIVIDAGLTTDDTITLKCGGDESREIAKYLDSYFTPAEKYEEDEEII